MSRRCRVTGCGAGRRQRAGRHLQGPVGAPAQGRGRREAMRGPAEGGARAHVRACVRSRVRAGGCVRSCVCVACVRVGACVLKGGTEWRWLGGWGVHTRAFLWMRCFRQGCGIISRNVSHTAGRSAPPPQAHHPCPSSLPFPQTRTLAIAVNEMKQNANRKRTLHTAHLGRHRLRGCQLTVRVCWAGRRKGGGGGGTRERGLSREGSAHEFEGPFINAKIQAMIGPPGHE